MLSYIIDGFNLVHKIASVRASPTPHQGLLDYLKHHRLTGTGSVGVTVVFDGSPAQTGTPGHIRVLYSGRGSADDVIKRLLDEAGKNSHTIVVSDDREVRGYARAAGAGLFGTGAFIQKPVTHSSGNTPLSKDISYPLQREITEEMRKIWDK
ncbi:MAG: NYN domain-containing protein [Candidatus Omnitrophota bacterium]